MRRFALHTTAVIAISIAASSSVFAWSTEQSGSQGANGANLASPLTSEETLKALQDKVSGGAEPKSGFFVSGGVNPDQNGSGVYGFQNPPGGAPRSFNFSPNPGFRGQ